MTFSMDVIFRSETNTWNKALYILGSVKAGKWDMTLVVTNGIQSWHS